MSTLNRLSLFQLSRQELETSMEKNDGVHNSFEESESDGRTVLQDFKNNKAPLAKQN